MKQTDDFSELPPECDAVYTEAITKGLIHQEEVTQATMPNLYTFVCIECSMVVHSHDLHLIFRL